VLLPAGAALVALGAWLLWRSRKPGGHRLLRRALVTAAAALAVYWVVIPLGMSIFATERATRRGRGARLGRAPRTCTSRRATVSPRRLVRPVENGAAVIVIPGEGGVRQARMLLEEGYGVLLLDPRGYGRSEGDPNAFGWVGRHDLSAAVDWLQSQADVRRRAVGALGLSVGGEQALDAAAHDRGLKAVVSEGAGIRSVRETFAREGLNPLQVWFQYPFDLTLTLGTMLFSGDPPPPSLEELVPRIAPNAAFFVYGENGQAIEPVVNVPYYRAAGEPKAIWEVPGAGHTGGIAAQPGEYSERVVGFFDEDAARATPTEDAAPPPSGSLAPDRARPSGRTPQRFHSERPVERLLSATVA
jgi:uncharacterized protein